MAYFLMGNRAAIILISLMLVSYYVTLPFYNLSKIYSLRCSLASLAMTVTAIVSKGPDGLMPAEVDPLIFVIVLLSISLLLLPLCFINDMRKFKVLRYFSFLDARILRSALGPFSSNQCVLHDVRV